MAQLGPDGGCHWTRRENPADVAEPWGTVVPEPLELDYRTYIGAVEIDYPPTLQIDTEIPEQGGEKTTFQHFINVRADVNYDSSIDSNDDDDTAEESGDGLIVNHDGSAEPPCVDACGGGDVCGRNAPADPERTGVPEGGVPLPGDVVAARPGPCHHRGVAPVVGVRQDLHAPGVLVPLPSHRPDGAHADEG
jgi:hypothetical protein